MTTEITPIIATALLKAGKPGEAAAKKAGKTGQDTPGAIPQGDHDFDVVVRVSGTLRQGAAFVKRNPYASKPLQWGALLYDATVNARAAVDLLACALAKASIGDPAVREAFEALELAHEALELGPIIDAATRAGARGERINTAHVQAEADAATARINASTARPQAGLATFPRLVCEVVDVSAGEPAPARPGVEASAR